MLKKIIAGDQPGAELAALDAAIRLDIPHEGWSYQGRKAKKVCCQNKPRLMESETPDFMKGFCRT